MTSTTVKPGRNEPCSCGSGKKYKQCCLAKDEAAAAEARAAARAAEAAEAAAAAAQAAEAEPQAEEHAAKAKAAAPMHAPKHATHQPWKATNSRGFAPKNRMPRKAGGS